MTEKARVNGVELCYELDGAGKDAMAFLNGIAMSIGHWKPFVEGLPGFRHLAHDFRGQILSEKPEGPISLADHAADLLALLDHLGIDKVHLVGTSYGSAAGFLLALGHPERILSMVVIDAADGIDPLLRAVIEAWRAAARANPSAFYRSLIPWTYSADYIGRSHGFFADREKAISGFPKAYFDCFVSLCDAFLGLDAAADLSRITCPTLVLEGGKDILTAGYGKRIAGAIPGADFAIMAGAGHAEVVEAPGPIIQEMRRFYSARAMGPAIWSQGA